MEENVSGCFFFWTQCSRQIPSITANLHNLLLDYLRWSMICCRWQAW